MGFGRRRQRLQRIPGEKRPAPQSQELSFFCADNQRIAVGTFAGGFLATTSLRFYPAKSKGAIHSRGLICRTAFPVQRAVQRRTSSYRIGPRGNGAGAGFGGRSIALSTPSRMAE